MTGIFYVSFDEAAFLVYGHPSSRSKILQALLRVIVRYNLVDSFKIL